MTLHPPGTSLRRDLDGRTVPIMLRSNTLRNAPSESPKNAVQPMPWLAADSRRRVDQTIQAAELGQDHITRFTQFIAVQHISIHDCRVADSRPVHALDAMDEPLGKFGLRPG